MPRTQAFGEIADAASIAWRGDLLRKTRGIARQIESLGSDDSRCLVVVVVFAGDVIRQPCQDHFGTRQSDQAYGFAECGAMIPGLERTEHVLAGRIGTVEKPGVHHAKELERPAALDFPLGAESSSLLVTREITATVAARSIDHGHALVLVEDGFGQIRRDHGLIVGMGDNHQNICLVAVVRTGAGGRLRNLPRLRGLECDAASRERGTWRKRERDRGSADKEKSKPK